MAISITWATKVINVPQSFLTPLGGTNYQLDTNAFRIALKDLEDDELGMAFPKTHNHNTTVTIGGLQYARTLEIINGYTVTFEDVGSPYKVFLVGSNNNILDVTNLNNVSVAPSNSAGLINIVEVQRAAFNEGVTINVSSGSAGTVYPIGSRASPVNNLADALTIAEGYGFDNLFVEGNLTVNSGQDISNYHLYGQGATFNVTKTLITLTAGCVTSNTHYHGARVTGYQGGECHYHECIIDALDNAHCHYERCGLVVPSGSYTIRQTAAPSTSHFSDMHDCYVNKGAAILDRNGTRTSVRLISFSGDLVVTNQNHPTQSGDLFVDLAGGILTVDASCTHGTITVTGYGSVVDNSTGTVVDQLQLLNVGETANRIWAHATAVDLTTKATIASKILRNKTITDPTTGMMTVYDDDGITPLLTAQLYEGTGTGQTYRGQGAERRERLA